MVVPTSSASRAAFASALLVTLVELGVLLVAIAPPELVVASRSDSVSVERITFFTPTPAITRPLAAAVSTAHGQEFRSATTRARSANVAPVTPPSAPRDSAPASSAAPSSAGAGAARLPGVGAQLPGPVLSPRGVTHTTRLFRAGMDSALATMSESMPVLIRARAPTQAERDAAYKEGALAIRLSGRALLVPADPHLASGMQLPSLFSRREQREAVRARTDSILAENMERLARLRERVRSDSIRRADSVSRATPRRPPDVRTPG